MGGFLGRILAAALAAGGLALAAAAQPLRMAVQADSSLDPHYIFLDSNVALHRHIFSGVTQVDTAGRAAPDLARAWRAVEPTVWEFELRDGVAFHDGSPFEAEDVLASVRRVRNLPNNPGPYTSNLQAVTRVEAVDRLRLRFHTDRPNPLLPHQLANILVVPRRFETAGVSEFRSGAAAIGTGPYRLAAFAPGERLALARADRYHGEVPPWPEVTIRLVGSAAARVAALLARDVDVIDFVPTQDAQQLARNPALAVHTGPSLRIMFVGLNLREAAPPGFADAAGRPLERNPLLDLRVRRALSLAVNRAGLVERVMDGFGVATSQFALPGILGHDPSLAPDPFDPAAARALLREAGYPEGFRMRLNCSNNRYPNDARLCEALAQMFTRAGLRTDVEAQPMNVFFPRLSRAAGPDAGLWLLGLGNSQGEASALWLVFRSADRAVGRGQFNFSGFGDPELDRLVDEAVATVDAAEREPRLQAAMRRATDAQLTVPLFGLSVIVATRAGLRYATSPNEHTLAMRVTPAQ
jgi:peptide/nickel transport system substrate-binding protein